MFGDVTQFNQDIGSWDVANVIEMQFMFNDASVFNNGTTSTIENWDVGSVTNMSPCLLVQMHSTNP